MERQRNVVELRGQPLADSSAAPYGRVFVLAAMVLLMATGLGVALVELGGPGYLEPLDDSTFQVVMAAVAVTLVTGAAGASILWHRITGDGRGLSLAVQALLLAGAWAVYVPGRGSDSDQLAATAGLAVGTLALAALSLRPHVSRVLGAWLAVGLALVVGNGAWLLIGSETDPYIPISLAAVSVGAVGLVILVRGYLAADWSKNGHGLALVATAMGILLVAEARDSHGGLAVVGFLHLFAASMLLNAVARELVSAYLAQQKRVFDAFLTANAEVSRHEAHLSAASERIHDVRSGLLALDAATQLLERSRSDGSFLQPNRLSEAVRSEVCRLQQLVASDADPIPPRPFLLAEALAPVFDCEFAAGRPVTVQVDSTVGACASAAETVQIVRTLLDNAARHAPGAPVIVSARVVGAVVELSVADRGPGLPPGLRVFDRGVTAHPDGNGIGLYVAHRLAVEMGGDLRARNRQGGGAEFVLELPSLAAAPDAVSRREKVDAR